jgi:DUF971 family protein
MPFPVKIKLTNNRTVLSVVWDNNKTHNFPLRFLRDESPDAGNKGETILWKHYAPANKTPDLPGKYEIDTIEQVGGYAVKIVWKDGYDFGIYSWDLLWRLGDYLELKDNISHDFEQEPDSNNGNGNKRDDN